MKLFQLLKFFKVTIFNHLYIRVFLIMKKSLFCASILGVSSLFQISAQAGWSGSYLFCVNEKNSNSWGWAPGSLEGVKGYPEASSSSGKGTWLNGYAHINYGLWDILKVNHTFKDEADAKNFCTELKNICTNEFGSKFTQVGVSTWAIPSVTWGQIQVEYNVDATKSENQENETKKSLICPNWESREFPKSEIDIAD
jgi:hypothetical protein